MSLESPCEPRFDKRYDWFKDCGDKEVLKERFEIPFDGRDDQQLSTGQMIGQFFLQTLLGHCSGEKGATICAIRPCKASYGRIHARNPAQHLRRIPCHLQDWMSILGDGPYIYISDYIYYIQWYIYIVTYILHIVYVHTVCRCLAQSSGRWSNIRMCSQTCRPARCEGIKDGNHGCHVSCTGLLSCFSTTFLRL